MKAGRCVEEMRAAPLVAIGLLVGGAALVVDAIVRGSARVALVVIVPVVVGGSAEFVAGVGLIALGLVVLPLALAYGPISAPPGEAESPPLPPERPGGSAFSGLVLIGPVPILFGSATRAPRWVRIALVLVGGAVFVLLVVAGWLAWR